MHSEPPTPLTPPEQALDELAACQANLVEARTNASQAASCLTGAGAGHAAELANVVADAIARCDRLASVLERDLTPFDEGLQASTTPPVLARVVDYSFSS
jgi:hypothetical protein